MTSPESTWFSRNSTFRSSSVGVTGASLSHKFVNTVRPNTGTGKAAPPPPMRKSNIADEEPGVADAEDGAFEQATALHDCK
jgi:hypothetical protein